MRRPEQSIQRAVLQFIRLQYPRALVYAIPNAAKRGVVDGHNFKLNGVRAGVADLIIHWAQGHTGYLEIKSEKGKLSTEQKRFAADCWHLGIDCECVKNVDEAAKALKLWGVV